MRKRQEIFIAELYTFPIAYEKKKPYKDVNLQNLGIALHGFNGSAVIDLVG